jgi:hypothetical protein
MMEHVTSSSSHRGNRDPLNTALDIRQKRQLIF